MSQSSHPNGHDESSLEEVIESLAEGNASMETAPMEDASTETAPMEDASMETAPMEDVSTETAPQAEISSVVETRAGDEQLSQQAPSDAVVAGDSQDEEDEEVLVAVRDFQQQLEQHLAATASSSQSAFDRLYEEMRQYKDNFLMQVQRGLLLDIILLHDTIHHLKTHYENASEVNQRDLLGNLEGLLVEAEEILSRRGVEKMYDSPEKLDRDLQKARGTIRTENPEEDYDVVEHLKSGFLVDDRPFRKQEVVIKRHTKPQTISEETG